MAGIFITKGSDVRIPSGGLRLHIGDDGEPSMDPLTLHLRTDMWPHWLREALDATVLAQQAAQEIADEVGGKNDDAQLHELLDRELRATMRAISSAAFAVDSFYASVQARSPAHPHREKWRKGQRRTPRQAQVFETLRYHLKMRNPGAAEARQRIKQLFKFRGWAVHADSKFREPVTRPELDRGVDWHYAVFRAENAANALAMTIQMLDSMVALLDRGSGELAKMQPMARERIDEILDLYMAKPGLPAIRTTRDQSDGASEADPPDAGDREEGSP